MKRKICLSLMIIIPLFLSAQIVDRGRPAEWENLVRGGRFMDRFMAMPDGEQQAGIWGADSVLNRYVDNGIEKDDISFWGGKILQSKDGKFHLYICGWPENISGGHMFWRNSTVYYAVSDKLHGPYKLERTIGGGHNPEPFRLKDGRIVLYVIDSNFAPRYYIADSEDSKFWTYGKFVFDLRDRRVVDDMTNLSFARRQDGSYLMMCRGGGIWVSQDGLSPYMQLTDKSVFPAVKGNFEDPVIWKDSLQYHMTVNDWLGRIAYYQRSIDGLHWVTEAGEAYAPGIARHKNGTVENWFKFERMKIFQDDYGRTLQANFAVIDTIKWNDLPNDKHSSKNIMIPMNKGLLLSVLNNEPISENTKSIKVRIRAESGFNPHEDLDLPSLRFGSHSEVNFGRGCKVIKTRKVGADLVITFDGRGSGIGENEFAPKLIGQNVKGELVYGYASLPYVNYKPAMLSARQPIYNKEKCVLELEVQNFGLSTSKPTQVVVKNQEKVLASGNIGALKPYEKKLISFKTEECNTEVCDVVFMADGKEIEVNNFRGIPKNAKKVMF